MLSREDVLESYFPEVRAWLIQIAAVMDRYERAEGEIGAEGEDALRRYRESLAVLAETEGRADRAERIQKIFSDEPEWEASMTRRG